MIGKPEIRRKTPLLLGAILSQVFDEHAQGVPLVAVVRHVKPRLRVPIDRRDDHRRLEPLPVCHDGGVPTVRPKEVVQIERVGDVNVKGQQPGDDPHQAQWRRVSRAEPEAAPCGPGPRDQTGRPFGFNGHGLPSLTTGVGSIRQASSGSNGLDPA